MAVIFMGGGGMRMSRAVEIWNAKRNRCFRKQKHSEAVWDKERKGTHHRLPRDAYRAFALTVACHTLPRLSLHTAVVYRPSCSITLQSKSTILSSKRDIEVSMGGLGRAVMCVFDVPWLHWATVTVALLQIYMVPLRLQ